MDLSSGLPSLMPANQSVVSARTVELVNIARNRTNEKRIIFIMANLRWNVLERLWQMVGGCQLPSVLRLLTHSAGKPQLSVIQSRVMGARTGCSDREH